VSNQNPSLSALQSEVTEILAKSVKSNRDIARGITIIENNLGIRLVVEKSPPVSNDSTGCRIGITGSPGVGKSSLVNSMLNYIDLGKTKVAVVAVDPSSRKTSGALLADRIRVSDNSIFDKIYFRSLASRGSYGGLVQNIDLIIEFLGYCGFDLVLVETVGVGQNEVDIEDAVDILIHVVDSKVGDSMQIAKAGVMEIGDIFFVNKNDMGLNSRYIEELATLPHLRKKYSNPSEAIISGSTITNEGVSQIIDLISRLMSADVFLRGRVDHE
jgi:LAO/AO transport system kinase